MPRPETDIQAGREKLLAAAENIIRERGAIDFTISDLATTVNMSQSNVYRFFDSKETLAEAMAGNWFADLIEIMEDVVNSDLAIDEKLFQFFEKRLALKRTRYDEDPDLFKSYMELGEQHFDVIRGYIDLGDHYMAIILAEAMEQGHFEGLALDEVVSLVNLMIQPFVNPMLMMDMMHLADTDRLHHIVRTILDGLHKGKSRGQKGQESDGLHVVAER